MNVRVLSVWESIRSSFWFIPALMAGAATGLSFATINLDRRIEYRWVQAVGWLWAGSAEGARAVLSTIASSMITVAGVVFSITIVALTLAASQFGPRLLRNFVRDRGNQIVLGTFLAAFLYCLLVLRTVRGSDEDTFVPYASVTCGIALAVVGLSVLIYFIHHVAVSIQVENLVADVGRELRHSVERLFPEQPNRDVPDDEQENMDRELQNEPAAEARLIHARESNYLQQVDDERLMRIAQDCDLLLYLVRRPGDFVIQGSALAAAWPPERCTSETASRLEAAFVLGSHRTPAQDVEYSVQQLVEIAVRALSPGVNEPFTAITCVDWLGATLSRAAEREIPSRYRYGKRGQLRIISRVLSFEDMLDAAFTQLRQYGASNAVVVGRLLEAIASVASHTRRDADRAALTRHAALIKADSDAQIQNEADRADVERRYRRALQTLADRAGRTENAAPTVPLGQRA